MGQRSVVVETGLDEEVEWKGEAYTRHARTRFVEARPKPSAPRAPELGDPWEPLTVRARLHRLAEVFRRLPHTPDTKPGGYKSCMPEPKREIFKDMPAEPKRLPVAREDYHAAMQVLDDVVKWDREQQLLGWGIACKIETDEMARHLRCSGRTVRYRKVEFLRELAERWNALGWRPDGEDAQRARKLITRNR